MNDVINIIISIKYFYRVTYQSVHRSTIIIRVSIFKYLQLVGSKLKIKR